jgi:hypothetical protein
MVVSYDGLPWICRRPDSTGAQPNETADWAPYFGPLSVSAYDDDTAYSAGELVYTTAGDGTNRTYLSLQDANEDDPATATAWAATVTYRKDDVVTQSSVTYLSLIDLNLNNDPSAAPALWSAATSYSIGDQVGATDGVIYASLTNTNVNHDPITDAVNWQSTGVLNPWTTVFTGGAGSLKWRQIGGAEFPSGVTLETIDFLYSPGVGPSSQSTSRNVFRLPANYVKVAPQDPKAGSMSWLGAPGNRLYDDWNYQDDYIVSAESGPLMLRFAANITDVSKMPAMFCEGWAARTAIMVCEPVTQSRDKISTIAGEYQKFMSEARMANAIEVGAVETPLDDWLACRY